MTDPSLAEPNESAARSSPGPIASLQALRAVLWRILEAGGLFIGLIVLVYLLLGTGSGPFVFNKDLWKPGDKTVYVKFDKYKPRSEPASGLAGGKVVKVDRVEWRAISDQQQAVNAIIAGEIDLIEQPSHETMPGGAP